MKYDLKKDLDQGVKVAVQWHGAPTLVLIEGDSVKTEVNTGDVLKVTLAQAKTLLRYSHLWTLEGDKPLEHGKAVVKAKKAASKAAKGSKSKKTAKDDEKDEDDAALTVADVEKMTEKEEVLAALEKMGEKANAEATLDELKSVLVEKLSE